jgi:hypothetical protein
MPARGTFAEAGCPTLARTTSPVVTRRREAAQLRRFCNALDPRLREDDGHVLHPRDDDGLVLPSAGMTGLRHHRG